MAIRMDETERRTGGRTGGDRAASSAGATDGMSATKPQLPNGGVISSPAGYDPNSAGFRSLPRELQRMVEGGQMSLDQASLQLLKSGGAPTQAGTGPVAFPSPTNRPAELNGGASQFAMPQSLPPQAGGQPGAFAGAQNRLSAGQALEGGRIGVDTFARKGGAAYDPFRGQEFGKELAQSAPGGRGVSAADALNFGNVGRKFLYGGASSNDGASSFLNDFFQVR